MNGVKVFKYKTALACKIEAPGGMLALAALLTELAAATVARSTSEIYPKAAELLDMAGFFEPAP